MTEYQHIRDIMRTERAKADEHRVIYNERLDAINNDTSRSDLWKQEERQKLRDEISPKLAAGPDVETQAINASISKLEQKLNSTFGTTGSDIIAYRDAQDRASNLQTEHDATRMIQQAARSGDNSLALAAFQRSLQELWMDPIDTFTENFPKHSATAKDLHNVITLRDDIHSKFARSNAYRGLA